MVKNLPAVLETWVQSLGREDILKKGMATYSSILAWKFHGQRSLVGYTVHRVARVRQIEQLNHHHHNKASLKKLLITQCI